MAFTFRIGIFPITISIGILSIAIRIGIFSIAIHLLDIDPSDGDIKIGLTLAWR